MKILINDVLTLTVANCYCISSELREIWEKFAILIRLPRKHSLRRIGDWERPVKELASLQRSRLASWMWHVVSTLIQLLVMTYCILLSVLIRIPRSLTSLSKLLSHYWQSSLKISPALLPVAEGQPLINLKNTEAISLEAISL